SSSCPSSWVHGLYSFSWYGSVGAGHPHCGLLGAAPTGQAVWPKASVTNPHKSDSAKNTREEFLIAPLTSSCCYAKLRKSQALKFSKNWLSAIFVDN
ncbi:hypothetical protein ABQF54_22020, partial [Xanthomonas campestris]|uniref:hypothetical protein n=1 Tax=Xanthomonas campestris TaxID=339 RepID=UPI0032E38557